MDFNQVLQKCRLFSGLGEQEIEKAKTLLCARQVSYKRGEIFRREGDSFYEFGLVLRGAVMVCTTDVNGNRMIMAGVRTGSTFGESLTFLGVKQAPIYVEAVSDCEILWMRTEKLFAPGGDRFALELQKRFTAMLAARTLDMNARIQILSKLTLREKILALFGSPEVRREGDWFVVNMNRQDMADYLGTNRSALCRELARMQKDGILEYKLNRFRLK